MAHASCTDDENSESGPVFSQVLPDFSAGPSRSKVHKGHALNWCDLARAAVMMQDDEIRDEFLKLHFGTERPCFDTSFEIALNLYAALKEIEMVVSRLHTSEMAKIIEIKFVLERLFHPASQKPE